MIEVHKTIQTNFNEVRPLNGWKEMKRAGLGSDRFQWAGLCLVRLDELGDKLSNGLGLGDKVMMRGKLIG